MSLKVIIDVMNNFNSKKKPDISSVKIYNKTSETIRQSQKQYIYKLVRIFFIKFLSSSFSYVPFLIVK